MELEAPTGNPTSQTTEVVSLEPLMTCREPDESRPRQVMGAKCRTTDVTILFLAMLKARRLLSQRPPYTTCLASGVTTKSLVDFGVKGPGRNRFDDAAEDPTTFEKHIIGLRIRLNQ
jgi:hypothetical protein